MSRFVLKASFLLVIAQFAICDGAVTCAWGQTAVRVSAARQVVLPLGYEQLLAKLEGEETTRAMFHSQHVDLLTYTPREAPAQAAVDKEQAETKANSQAETSENPEDNTVRAVIDSTACSTEFGWMAYTTTIIANSQQTTIDVELVRPAGMLLNDHYHFSITPIGSDQSSLSVTHSLDVRLMKRRLEIVNQLIRKITCREASSQVQQLTEAMAQCLVQIALRPVQSSTTASDNAPSDNEDAKQDEDSDQDEDIDHNEDSDQADAEASETQANPITTQLAASPGKASDSPKLVVRMKVGKAGKGSVRLAIFDSESQFRKFDARKEEKKQGEAFRKQEVKVGDEGWVECTFDDVPAGNYVIAAFQDIDGNSKLNASFLGLPSEPYGFSRDARGQLGAPNYKDAEIKFDAEHPLHEFSLK